MAPVIQFAPPINGCNEDDDPSLSVTALTVVLALIFIAYFALRIAVPDLPLHIHSALVDLPSAKIQGAGVVLARPSISPLAIPLESPL